jgi:hypothetical protein
MVLIRGGGEVIVTEFGKSNMHSGELVGSPSLKWYVISIC